MKIFTHTYNELKIVFFYIYEKRNKRDDLKVEIYFFLQPFEHVVQQTI